MSGVDDLQWAGHLDAGHERTDDIDEHEIHDVLRNERRQMVIKELQSSVRAMTLNELAETLAEAETGESPPPRNIRKSVYSALHQSHLPKLDEAGIVRYDRNRKTVSLGSQAKNVDPYMDVVTRCGVTWETYYRRLALVSLVALLGAELDVSVLGDVPMAVLVAAALAVVTLSATYQLWSDRWRFLRSFLD